MILSISLKPQLLTTGHVKDMVLIFLDLLHKSENTVIVKVNYSIQLIKGL